MMMKQTMTAALLALALSGCTTAGIASNPLEARWVGRSAGTFFAAYGPPLSDIASGSSTRYTWRGGYARGRSCAVELVVGSDYTIRSIVATRNPAGRTAGGPSHCEEVLDAA